MARHFTPRRLANLLVSALLVVGTASPAFAQRQDHDDDQEDGKPRKQQLGRQPQRAEQAERQVPPQEQPKEPTREQVRQEAPTQRPTLQQGNGRWQPEREEHWDRGSREREQKRRENLDVQTPKHDDVQQSRAQQEQRQDASRS